MYSQKRLALFTVILVHLQQPAVAPLPQEGGGIWVFTALTAHVQFNVWGTDGAAELCGERVCFRFKGSLTGSAQETHTVLGCMTKHHRHQFLVVM